MNATANGGNHGRIPWRPILWGGAAALLALPAVAMRFTNEVNWTGGDFVFAALLFGTVGLGLELAFRASRSMPYRMAVGAALGASFLIVWANGAVGMIGNEDNPYNLLFLGVIGLALAGAAVARFRAQGMALAMAVAGLAHAGVALGGFAVDPRGAVFSLVFALPWLLSAALFRSAGKAAA